MVEVLLGDQIPCIPHSPFPIHHSKRKYYHNKHFGKVLLVGDDHEKQEPLVHIERLFRFALSLFPLQLLADGGGVLLLDCLVGVVLGVKHQPRPLRT